MKDYIFKVTEKERVKYRNFKFEVVKTMGGSWTAEPLSYNTQAIIIESTKEECIEANKRYIDRILHYNYNK